MFKPRTKSAFKALRLESMENRWLFAGISISDAVAIEGSDTLKFIDRFVADGDGGLARSRGSVFGPDGNGDGAADLYVGSVDTNQVLRYDGHTGAFLDVFVPAGLGGLDGPADLKFFGPDNDLYVTGRANNGLLRFDGTNGQFVERIIGGAAQPFGLATGDDGRLFVVEQVGDDVLCFDGTVLSTFIPTGSGGLNEPRNAAFGPDGNGDGVRDLYVASQSTRQVLRYDGATGAFVDVFATGFTFGAMWLGFGNDGYLYVTDRIGLGLETSILRFNERTGAFVDKFDLSRDGWSFMLGPDNLVYNSANGAGGFVERFGHSSLATFTITLSEPSASPVTVAYTTTNGSATAGSDYRDTSGTLTFAPGQISRTILVPSVDNLAHEANETFSVVLSNAVGATITDDIGVATITDNDVAGDANGDGLVNLADLNAVRNNFGASGVNVPGDTNGDGQVDLSDLNAVRNNFGSVDGNGAQNGAPLLGGLDPANHASVTRSQRESRRATDLVFDMLMSPALAKKPFSRR